MIHIESEKENVQKIQISGNTVDVLFEFSVIAHHVHDCFSQIMGEELADETIKFAITKALDMKSAPEDTKSGTGAH